MSSALPPAAPTPAPACTALTRPTAACTFCRDLPDDPEEDIRGSEFYAGADLHIMGRVGYQSMAGYFPDATDDPDRRRH